MGKWKVPVIYTTAGVLIGSTLMAASPAMAAQTGFKTFVANLIQNGQTVSKPSAIAYNGTSYFGIWWLQQQLLKDGIDVQWNGKSLTLTNMPVQSTDTLSVQGTSGSSTQTVFANSINVNGTTYVPLSEVQALLQQAGSGLKLHTGHDDGIDGEQQGANFDGVIHQLQSVSQKLSQYQSGQVHGDDHGVGEMASSFAGSLMQLRSAIGTLNQIEQSGATGGATSAGTTGTTGTTGSTGTTSSQSGTTSISGSGTTSSSSTGTAGTTGTSSATTSPAQLGDIVTSLQNDWTALNTYAVQTITGAFPTSTSATGSATPSTSSSSGSGIATTSGTSTDLSTIIADINAQIQALSSLSGTNAGFSGGEQDH